MKEEIPVIVRNICNKCFGLRIRYSKTVARLIKCKDCKGTGEK